MLTMSALRPLCAGYGVVAVLLGICKHWPENIPFLSHSSSELFSLFLSEDGNFQTPADLSCIHNLCDVHNTISWMETQQVIMC